MTKYGIILARTIFIGFIGDTSSTSMLPVSFSLTMDTEVISAQISSSISPMIPGTKLYELFNCGLYSILRFGVMRPPPPEWPADIAAACMSSPKYP